MTRTISPYGYILSHPRSGSTLAGLAIAMSPDVIFIGEEWSFFNPETIEREVCRCGAPLIDCPFWGPVEKEMQAQMGHNYRQWMYPEVMRLLRSRPAWKLLQGAYTPSANFLNAMRRFYQLLFQQAGAKKLLSSGKFPGYLLFLWRFGIVPKPLVVVTLRHPPAALHSYLRTDSFWRSLLVLRRQYRLLVQTVRMLQSKKVPVVPLVHEQWTIDPEPYLDYVWRLWNVVPAQWVPPRIQVPPERLHLFTANRIYMEPEWRIQSLQKPALPLWMQVLVHWLLEPPFKHLQQVLGLRPLDVLSS